MSIFKPPVTPSGERKRVSLWAKAKTPTAARGLAAVEFEGRRMWAAEGHFVQALRLERKRAERSGQAFLLMLLEGAEILGRNGGSRFFAVSAALGRAIRDTDLCGWYRQSRTLGVIFTEVNGAAVAATVEALRGKVEACLCPCLKQKEAERIQISFHLFPEPPNGHFDNVTIALPLGRRGRGTYQTDRV